MTNLPRTEGLDRRVNDSPLILNVDHDSGHSTRSTLLQQAGFRVVAAASAAEALRLLTDELPALVLIDVRLPDILARRLAVGR